MAIEKHVLENGLSVIFAPQKGAKTITVLVGVRAGSRMETKETNGIAHFLEHMMFKGTKKRKTALDITKELDGIGAQYNAFTSKDYTGYYIHASAKYAQKAMDVLSDMVINTQLPAKEIEKERGVIIEEIKMYEDNPLMYVEDVLENCMFKGNKLGWHIIGTRKNIRNVKRKDFADFKEKHYRGENMALIISGAITDAMMKEVKKYFGKLPGKGKRNQPEFDIFMPKWNGPSGQVFEKQTDQAQMGIGFVGYEYLHPDMPALQLLSIILGGNMSSRLFTEVREKRGLAYYVRTSVNPYQDTGNFYVQAGLDRKRLDDAVTTIVKELKKVKSNGVTADELKKAKTYLQGMMDLGLEDSSSLAQYYFRQELLTGKNETPKQKMNKINAVKGSDIKRVAQDIFRADGACIALIGPYKNTDKYVEMLKKV